MLVKLLSLVGWLRYLFVPLVLFLSLAILGLVLKSSTYVGYIFIGIFTESSGNLVHYALALVDVALVVGLLMLIVGHLVFTYILTGEEVGGGIPEWRPERFAAESIPELKLKIAVTVLLIATIDLLGEFIRLSVTPLEEIPALMSDRLWYLLALYGALLLTVVVLIFFARSTTPPSGASDNDSG